MEKKMMDIKGAGLAIATTAILGLGAFVNYGFGAITGYAATMQYEAAYQQTDNTAYNLITNYKAKIKSANSFSVNEMVTTEMSIGGTNENESSATSRSTVVEGDKVHSIIASSKSENGREVENVSGNMYQMRVGDVNRQFTVTSEGTEVTETPYTDCRDSYFPVTYHGNETVTFENGEYVVKGWLTQDDYKSSTAINGSTATDDYGIGDMFKEAIGDMPYECRFDAATGDLNSMTIDMSGIMNGVVSMFKMFMDDSDASKLDSIKANMTYKSSIKIDPSLTVFIPTNLG